MANDDDNNKTVLSPPAPFVFIGGEQSNNHFQLPACWRRIWASGTNRWNHNLANQNVSREFNSPEPEFLKIFK
jgi:hypothetical protein